MIFIYSSQINRSKTAIVSTDIDYDLLCAENIKFCMLGEFQIQNTVYFSNVSSSYLPFYFLQSLDLDILKNCFIVKSFSYESF